MPVKDDHVVSRADHQRWDARYEARAGEPFPPPDPLLLQYTPPAHDGRDRALDLACGRGQNGLWLAEQGYTVDLLDVSRVALTLARDEAGRRNLRSLNFLSADLDTPDLDTGVYDLICVFRFLSRPLFPALRAAIRPGGRVLYETYHTGHLQQHPTFNPAHVLDRGELETQFSDWRVLRCFESDTFAQIVTLKPTGPTA
jgi:SAM-dependent methyltransferase